jgi:predicted nucleic acid-binding Zn ribbon protein
MVPVREVIPRALAALIREAPLTPEKVVFAWRNAVGPAVARATEVELRDGVLYVRARDAAWRREIERSAALVRSRLQSLLGDEAVRYIRVSSDREVARSFHPPKSWRDAIE